MTDVSTPARAPFLHLFVDVEPLETRAAVLAFALNFVLLGSYYILRPLRDTMATVFGPAELQDLFTGTFLFTLVCAPLYAAVASRVTLKKFLPGAFWFWLSNILIFYALFHLNQHNRWIAAAYYWWFSVVNLFLVSVFWTLMADLFSDNQATRLFAFIAAGGSIGAIFGPIVTATFVNSAGVDGLLLIAAGGFVVIIALIHLLMREKERMRGAMEDTQKTTLTHTLPGNPFRGFELLLKSRYLMYQALFFLLMTWIATIQYFLQADLISKAYSDLETRTLAFANVDLVVNVCSAAILILGISHVVRRFGVTFGLVITPITMALAFVAIFVSPTLFVVQAARSLQRITQYAIARPCREILFTVVDQQTKYKAKNVIDTTAYRFGDVSAAWMNAGLQSLGLGLAATGTLGVAAAGIWGFVALALGRSYERMRKNPQTVPADA